MFHLEKARLQDRLELLGNRMDYLLRLPHLTLGACGHVSRCLLGTARDAADHAGLMRIQRCNIEDEGVTRPCTRMRFRFGLREHRYEMLATCIQAFPKSLVW